MRNREPLSQHSADSTHSARLGWHASASAARVDINAALKENIVAVAPHGRQAVALLAAILPHQEISF
jgi:hypothetical protein